MFKSEAKTFIAWRTRNRSTCAHWWKQLHPDKKTRIVAINDWRQLHLINSNVWNVCLNTVQIKLNGCIYKKNVFTKIAISQKIHQENYLRSRKTSKPEKLDNISLRIFGTISQTLFNKFCHKPLLTKLQAIDKCLNNAFDAVLKSQWSSTCKVIFWKMLKRRTFSV